MTLEHVKNNNPSLRVNTSQRESKTSRRTKTRFENRFAKGENRARRRAKIRFKIKFAKGESKTCKRGRSQHQTYKFKS
jgi:hypothetical protein